MTGSGGDVRHNTTEGRCKQMFILAKVAEPGYFDGAREGSQSAELCVPSQNGLFDDWPQRQRKKGFPSLVSTRFPSPSNSTVPASTL